MRDQDIHPVIKILRQEVQQWKTPAVTVVAGERNPFHVLVSCILSLRTRDETTGAAFARLKQRADTPQGILKIPEEELAQIIYPVGFYNTKAKTLHETAAGCWMNMTGKFRSMDELLTFSVDENGKSGHHTGASETGDLRDTMSIASATAGDT